MSTMNRTGAGRRHTGVAALLATAAAFAPGLAGAQSAATGAGPEVEEIVVTAQKREQSILDVPISVTALSDKQLERQGFDDIDDFVRAVPNLVLQVSEVGASFVAIRGVYSASGAPTVGVYLDETPVQVNQRGFTGNANPKLFDLDRIEVLRGPQGTLFGASSLGGTLRYITRQPSLTEWSARGLVEGALTEGGAPSWQVSAAGGGPLAQDKVGVRLSAYYRRDGGYIDKADRATGAVVERDINDEDTLALRGAVTFRLWDSVDVTPSIFYQKIESDDLPIFERPGAGRLQEFRYFRQGFPVDQPGEDEFYLPTLTVKGDFGPVTVTSITSVFHRDDRRVTDYSSLATELVLVPILGPDLIDVETSSGSPNFSDNRQRNFTQELRFSQGDPNARLQWTVGGFYQRSKLRFTQIVSDPGLDDLFTSLFGVPVGGILGNPTLPGAITYIGREKFVELQLAVFGEASFKLTPWLEAVAGARVSGTDTETRVVADGPFNGGPTPPANAGTRRTNETPVTPRFGVNLRPGDDHLVYASASKGYRSGGGNLPVPVAVCGDELATLGLSGSPDDFGADELWNYELGYKGSLARRRLTISAAVFQIDWDDIQQNVFLPGCGFGFVGNLGKARSRGVEFEAQARPAAGLTLTGAFSYTDAEFRSDVTLDGETFVLRDGDRLPSSPDWTAAASAEYAFHLGRVSPYLRVDYQYRGELARVASGEIVRANRFLYEQKPYSYVSARAGATLDGWEAAFFVENLLDARPGLFRSTALNPVTDFRAREVTLRPRTFGVTLSRSY